MSSEEPDRLYEKIRQIQKGLDETNLEIFANTEQIAQLLRDIASLEEKNRELRLKASHRAGQIEGLSDARWLRK